MATWSCKLANRYLEPLKTKNRYKNQLYEFLRDYKDKQKRIGDIIDKDVKEG